MPRSLLIIIALIFPVGARAQEPLKPIDLRTGIYLARLEIQITVTPEGHLRSVRTENQSYGRGDISPDKQRVTIREGKLTPEQITELAKLFANWDAFEERYGAKPDDAHLSIRYGDKTVTGGRSNVPEKIDQIRIHLSKLAESMPDLYPRK